MARLTLEKWSEIRAQFEVGASARELSSIYGISHTAINKKAEKEGWTRNIEPAIRRKVSEKVSGYVSSDNLQKRAEAIDAEAERRAAVIERHRNEWPEMRGMVERGREAHKTAQGLENKRIAFEDLKAAKIASETLKIIQDGERRAWGLDQIVDVTKLTDEQLATIAKGKMPT
nr:hypothetical protein [Nitrosomonas nitrosa]